jgi:hypothetical protein
VTRRIFSAVVAGLLLVAAACTGDEPSPAPDDSASMSAVSPSADPTEPTPPSEPTQTSAEPTPTSAEPTEPSPDPSATPSDREEQALLDHVRDEGELSVIVEVALEGTAAPNSTEERQLIERAQDDLVAELDPAHVSVQTRFERTAQLTLTVDEEGLLALFASPRVTRVWENESIPLE